MKETEEKYLDHVVQLTSALIASGHFTRGVPEEDEASVSPYFITADFGKDWKETGEPERRPSEAVLAAMELLSSIKKQIVHTKGIA